MHFTGITCRHLQLESAVSAAAGEEPWPAEVAVDSAAGSPNVTIKNSSTQAVALQQQLSPNAAWQAGDRKILLASSGSRTANKDDQQGGEEPCSTLLLQCSSREQAEQLWQALQPKQQQTAASAARGAGSDADKEANNKAAGASSNVFDAKTAKGSAELYFHYYGMLMHQQNMLQDTTRTGTYYAAITENRSDFEGKTVMDVGAGSGILSLFAAQAGARKVFAVEASGMSKYAQQLASKNEVGKVVQVCHCKVEELVLPDEEGRVDVLVSEPMGTLLVNERMLETYLYARDRFLKPGGRMFPQLGRIHAAAFSDNMLHSELLGKASFWQQNSFFGLDMTTLHQPAVEGYFAQVVVDAFDPSVLVSDCATRVLDFATMKEEELYDITIPLNLTVAHPCTLHGIACWFDVLFNGTTTQRWLSTAPGLPTTHWFQLRCCLQQPLVVLVPNSKISGTMRLVAHERQSYDVHVELHSPPVAPGMPPQKSCGSFDLKEPYYRLSQWAQPVQQQQVIQQQPVLLPAIAVQQPVAGAAAAATAAATAAGVPVGGTTQQQFWGAATAVQQPAHGMHAV